MEKILIIELEGQLYGLNIENVFEILNTKKIEKVPLGTENIIGVVDIRNKIFKVINTKKILNIRETKNFKYFILTQINKEQYVLVADNIIGISQIVENKDKADDECNKIDTNNDTMASSFKYIDGIYSYQNKLIAALNLLDIEKEL